MADNNEKMASAYNESTRRWENEVVPTPPREPEREVTCNVDTLHAAASDLRFVAQGGTCDPKTLLAHADALLALSAVAPASPQPEREEGAYTASRKRHPRDMSAGFKAPASAQPVAWMCRVDGDVWAIENDEGSANAFLENGDPGSGAVRSLVPLYTSPGVAPGTEACAKCAERETQLRGLLTNGGSFCSEGPGFKDKSDGWWLSGPLVDHVGQPTLTQYFDALGLLLAAEATAPRSCPQCVAREEDSELLDYLDSIITPESRVEIEHRWQCQKVRGDYVSIAKILDIEERLDGGIDGWGTSIREALRNAKRGIGYLDYDPRAAHAPALDGGRSDA